MISKMLLLAVLFVCGQAASQAHEFNTCSEPIVVKAPPMGVVCPECASRPEMAGVKVKELRFDIVGPISEARHGRSVEVFQIEQTLDLDVNQFNQNFKSTAQESMPKNDCENNYHAHGFGITPTHGNALGEFSLRYKRYVCASFKSVCCRHLKCRKCTEHVSTFLVQNTFDIDVPFVPETFDNAREFKISPGKPSVDDHGFKRNVQVVSAAIAAMLGDATLGSLGSVGGGVAAWKATGKEIEKRLAALPTLEPIKLENASNSGDSLEAAMFKRMRYVKEKSRFYGSSSDLGLRLVKRAAETPNVFCKLVRPQLAEYAALLRSHSQSENETEVKSGDTLWSIAERYYGNGRYFIAIAEDNFGSLDKVPAVLRPGSKLIVTPMHQLLSTRYLVQGGDNLWSIAKAQADQEPTYLELAKRNEHRVRNAELIYPLQRLLVEKEGGRE